MKETYLIPSVERNIGPDSTITLDFALSRLSELIKNLNIYPNNMKKNLSITNGIFFSQRVLLELTNVGFSRENVIQNCSKKCFGSLERKLLFF